MFYPKSVNGRDLVRAAVATVLGTATLFAAPYASAAEDEEITELEEVQVTGSRIVRRDFTSPSPVVTVSAEQLTQSSNVALEANLNKLPQFVPSLSQLITGDIQPTAQNTPGTATVNLRGLGANRNVVIIDGRRAMPVNSSLVIDLNTIPSAAVERVEVITGGASSTYGADAVGGVVNFIMKRNFEGLIVDGQYGITQDGNAEEKSISALLGGNFADGRGNVMFGAVYSDREAAFLRDSSFYRKRFRDPTVGATDFWWTETSYGAGFANQPTPGAIDTVFDTLTPGSVAPSSNFFLNDDGSLYASGSLGFDFFTGVNGLGGPGMALYNGDVDGMFRRQNANGSIGQNDLNAYMSTPMERYSTFGRGRFEFSDSLSAVVQGTLSQTSVDTISQFSPAITGWGANIPHGANRNCQTLVTATAASANKFACQDADFFPGATALGLAPGITSWAQVPTSAAYLPGGSAGLTGCVATGGCTNSQAFQVGSYSPDLAFLLNNRTDPNGVWSLNEVFDWLKPRSTTNNNVTYQVVTGLEGRLPYKDWTWEAFVSHGQSTTSTITYGVVSLDSYRAIVSSPNFGRGFVWTQNSNEFINGIPGGGNFAGARVTCTSGLPVLQNFEVSQDCVDALTHDLQNRQKLEQTIQEANVQGGLFQGWAGEARFAAGVSRRVNSFEYQADPLTSINNFLDSAVGIFPLGDSAGRTTVKEVYGELLMPVLADLPLVDRLTLELGYRYSDQNPSGSVDTWKALASWKVNDYVSLRGGHQVASRAPNIGELYSGRTQLFVIGGTPSQDLCHPTSTRPNSANPATNPGGAAATQDLCEEMMGATGATRFYVTDTPATNAGGGLYQVEGNPTVQPEKAKTWTVGFVASMPSDNPLLSGLRFTADWYEINLSDAITTTQGDAIMDRCFDPGLNPSLDSQNIWCQALVRNPDTGTLAVTNALYSNESRYLTAGYDFQIDWSAALADFGTSAPGRLGFNFQASFLDKFQEWGPSVNNGNSYRDWKGFEGPNLTGNTAGGGGSFKYRLFTTVNYSHGDWGLTLRHRYMPKINAADELTAPGPAGAGTIAATPSWDIFDLSGTWNVNSTLSLRAGVDNLLDNDPPVTGRNTSQAAGMVGGSLTTSGNGIYDPFGRRFFVGLNAKF
jgi:iron complex outermembrane receptor protein